MRRHAPGFGTRCRSAQRTATLTRKSLQGSLERGKVFASRALHTGVWMTLVQVDPGTALQFRSQGVVL
jgi:hypothetical protein